MRTTDLGNDDDPFPLGFPLPRFCYLFQGDFFNIDLQLACLYPCPHLLHRFRDDFRRDIAGTRHFHT